jgi:tRNA isopentenyl-2-thiomethyl-A-37 hydroxylase MiaE
MPYEGEAHYSLYLSLFGQDLKAGQTRKVRSRFVVAESISDNEIVERYVQYIAQLESRKLSSQK